MGRARCPPMLQAPRALRAVCCLFFADPESCHLRRRALPPLSWVRPPSAVRYSRGSSSFKEAEVPSRNAPSVQPIRDPPCGIAARRRTVRAGCEDGGSASDTVLATGPLLLA